jgi:hypothetical protein
MTTARTNPGTAPVEHGPNQKARLEAILHVLAAQQILKNIESPADFLDRDQVVALMDFLEDR